VDFQNTSGSHGPWQASLGVLKITPGLGGSEPSFTQKNAETPIQITIEVSIFRVSTLPLSMS